MRTFRGADKIACSFPIVARRFPDLPIPHRFLFISRHFGTGVLIATAFIHLLPTAFISMTDPCLPRFWNKTYPPMPGLVAMLSVFMVVSIEQFFAIRGAGHSHDSEFTGGVYAEEGDDRHGSRARLGMHANGHIPLHNMDSPSLSAEGHDRFSKESQDPDQHRDHEHESDDDSDDLDALDPLASDDSAYLHLNRPSASQKNQLHRHHSHGHDSMSRAGHLSDPENPQKLFLQCLLLEAGILFHSIFIGMAVSVATGTEFVVLLIAICFHQTFEGFALGARIANLIPILFDPRSPKPWLMALAYGMTTPIGQAIGLWLHELYDPNSEVGLLTVGITNAISSGLLLFAGLVQLVAEDFLSERSYETLRGKKRWEANIAVACGGILMGIVGAFA